MFSANNSGSDHAEENHLQNFVLSEEEFTVMLLRFFNSARSFKFRNEDQSELILESWNRFQSFMKQDVNLEYQYYEFLLSVFEICPHTSYKVIREVLKNLVFRKVEEYCYVREKLTRYLPLSMSFFEYVDYYTDPLAEEIISAESFGSPSILLDYGVVETLIRYGVCFRMNPRHTQSCLRAISSCLTMKLLPLVCKDVEWDVYRIMPAYQTYQEQRRLYLVLMLQYSVFATMNCSYFQDKQEYTRSLKLVFKASTEPFITAQEIDRFLRVAAVREIDDKVKEDIYKKLAEEFPRIKEPSTPRSLQQLSRCRIRESLAISRALPHGVWSLNLPMKLKHYLLLQEKLDEFYPAYVSTINSYSRKRLAEYEGCTKRLRTNV